MIKELGNDLMSNLKFYKEVMLQRPNFNKKLKLIKDPVKFSNPNMLIIDKGRHSTEQSVVLIENNQYIGNTFVDLHYQINNIEILRNLITREENNNNNRFLIKNHLQNNKVKKIIRF